MSKTITVFDHRKSPRFGAKFSGSIENTDSRDTIGYLDFLTPSQFLKKADDDLKKWAENYAVFAEKSDITTYISGIKDPATKAFSEQSLVLLQAYGDDVIVVILVNNDVICDDLIMSQTDGNAGRYVGFDNTAHPTIINECAA